MRQEEVSASASWQWVKVAGWLKLPWQDASSRDGSIAGGSSRWPRGAAGQSHRCCPWPQVEGWRAGVYVPCCEHAALVQQPM